MKGRVTRREGYVKNHLSEEAKKVENIEVISILKDLRKREIDLYRKIKEYKDINEFLKPFNVIESCLESNCKTTRERELVRKCFGGNSNPEVNGVSYYKGFAIERDSGVVLIYEPWITVTTKEYLVYTLGEVKDEEVLEIIQILSTGFNKYLYRELEVVSNNR